MELDKPMKKILLALALLIPGPAWAQCTGVFPPNTLCGNLSGSPAPPSAFTASTVAGPGSTTVGDVAIWNNTTGSLLKDVPPLQIYGTIGNNLFLSGPSTGGPLFPTFRAITQTDIQTAFNAALSAISNPTTQPKLSGSGTYTTPAGVAWIEIELQGAGGGGAGGGTNVATAGGTGGNTCWNTSGAACTTPVYQAGGGTGGQFNVAATANGGTVSGSATCYKAIAGGAGGSGVYVVSTNSLTGGHGGSSANGGPGAGGTSTAGAGTAGATNSGSGGGGGGGPGGAGNAVGNGGGAGANCRVIISAPAATYTFAVGVAGTAGALGGTGGNGAAGGSGGIWVIEHYTP
jgi:hypothetical protein